MCCGGGDDKSGSGGRTLDVTFGSQPGWRRRRSMMSVLCIMTALCSAVKPFRRFDMKQDKGVVVEWSDVEWC